MNQDQKDFLLWCYQEGIAFDAAVKAASFIDAQSSSKIKELENWKADAIERIAELELENTVLRKANNKLAELEKRYERLLLEKVAAGEPVLVKNQTTSFINYIKETAIRVGYTPLKFVKVYQGVDTSTPKNDFTAIVTVGVDEGGRVWIVDAERRRVGLRDALDFIKEKAARWRPDAIALKHRVMTEELLRSTDLPVFQVRPDKDKLTRAQGLITRYENGLVWHSESLPRYFVEEILSFGPDCEHDDLVDAAVYAYMQIEAYFSANEEK